MAEIDMIPRSYREGLRARRTLAAYGAALGLLLLAGGGASALLRWRLAVETPQLEQARAGSVRTSALRTQLASAQTRKDTLAEGVGALAALRGAGEVDALAALLDGALSDKVWFEQLRFARSQELLQTAPPVLPPGTVQVRMPGSGTVQAWRVGSQVEIDGRALDNAAMTAFLAALAANPALGDVRFLNSSTQAPEDGGAVAFKAAGSLVARKETP
jgi:Tfp pilus assembly protein PilN